MRARVVKAAPLALLALLPLVAAAPLAGCDKGDGLGDIFGGGPQPEPPGDGDGLSAPGNATAPPGGTPGQQPQQPTAGAGAPGGMVPPPAMPGGGDNGQTPAPGGDGMMDSGEPVAGDPTAEPPRPVDACGEDPESDAGTVAPDYSNSRDGGVFDGDPGEGGPLGVTSVQVVIPNPDSTRPALNGTYYVPAPEGAFAGPRPLVVVLHGFGTNHLLYEHFSTHLASHGLLVLGMTLPGSFVAAHDKNADELMAAIDFTLGPAAPAQVQGRADPERVAAAGHSFGGKIAFYAAALDPRIDIVIGWDPSNAGGPPCFIDPNACNDFVVAPNCLAMDPGLLFQMRAETLVFRAAPDGANPEPAHNAIHFFRGAPAPATMLDYGSNAGHGDWANAAALPIEHTRRVQLALLLTRFTGVSGLEGWLPGGADIASGPGVDAVLVK